MEIDHILLAVGSLEQGAAEIQARHGLTSVEGGRHPGWGTANRIVPLGDAYLELVAVVDAAEASSTAFGRWVAQSASPSLRPLGWAVRVNPIDEHARRLGIDTLDGRRELADGSVLSWRTAGLEEAAACPLLPFFIEWDGSSTHPGRGRPGLRTGTISRLELTGEPDELGLWLGEHELPLVVRPGEPALRRAVVETAVRTIELAADD